MSDFAFKPAGAAFAAIVAGIAPGVEQAEAAAPAPAAEAEAVGVDYASLPAAEPMGDADVFADLDAVSADVPLAPSVQLNLPFA